MPVFEVRFISPIDGEVLFDEMILANKTSEPHNKAVSLALNAFSGGVGVLKSMKMVEDGVFQKAGCNACWRYIYRLALEKEEFELLAVIFGYRLKGGDPDEQG